MIELIMDSFKHPHVIFLVADEHVRPGPPKSAMVIMVLREVVGQHFAVKTVKRMDVTAASAISGDVGPADDTKIVNREIYRSLRRNETVMRRRA